ncbi:MAG: hypothetical protein ABJF23_23915 [Bryobacteraceae bacterium]
MGAEALCTAHFNQQASEGKALLETDYLLFRGDFRVKIPFPGIQQITAGDGQLRVRFADGTLALDLGAAAEKWMRKIQHPPSLLEKLGVKAGTSVAVLNIEDEAFQNALKSISHGLGTGPPDLVFLGIEAEGDLEQIEKYAGELSPAGALWLVWPKGRKHITAAQVMAAGKAAGLVDTKIASFSSTHTAMKWVIPVARRARKA